MTYFTMVKIVTKGSWLKVRRLRTTLNEILDRTVDKTIFKVKANFYYI